MKRLQTSLTRIVSDKFKDFIQTLFTNISRGQLNVPPLPPNNTVISSPCTVCARHPVSAFSMLRVRPSVFLPFQSVYRYINIYRHTIELSKPLSLSLSHPLPLPVVFLDLNVIGAINTLQRQMTNKCVFYFLKCSLYKIMLLLFKIIY